MNVKVKRKDKTQSGLPIIFVIVFFGVFSIPIIFAFAKSIIEDFSFKNFVMTFSQFGMPLLFAIVFGTVDLYIISFLVRKPRKYIAILEFKETEQYMGQTITNMSFRITQKAKNDVNPYEIYRCYSNGENDLEINKEYIIDIKEAYYKIKTVNEIDNYAEKERIIQKNENNNDGKNGFRIPLLALLFVFGVPIIILIWKLVFDIRDKLPSNVFGDIVALIIFIAIFSFILYITRSVVDEKDE